MSEASERLLKLTGQQQRVIKLLFKFRFVSALGLAQVMGISRSGVYQILESLVSDKLVDKVYSGDFRIDRKPGYYYLNKAGVTTVRKLLDVKESVVHPLYKNDTVSDAFIQQCLDVLVCFASIRGHLPTGSELFTKSEIKRFSEFPRNRPDLYIRTPGGQEAIVIFGIESQSFILKKRLDEVIAHSEDEGWEGGYPLIAFVLKNAASTNSFLYRTARALDSMGIDDSELLIVAAPLKEVTSDNKRIWASVYSPREKRALFE